MRARSAEGGVWVFRPQQHKTQHHGHARVVVIGPQAQEVLRPFIDAKETYIFSPRAAERMRHAERRANRKSPLTPSQAARKPKVNPKRAKRERHDETSSLPRRDRVTGKVEKLDVGLGALVTYQKFVPVVAAALVPARAEVGCAPPVRDELETPPPALAPALAEEPAAQECDEREPVRLRIPC